MTEERLPLQELLAKAGDGDFLRAVAQAVLQLLMEADVEGLIGAGRYERSGERLNWRNGHRERTLEPPRICRRLSPLRRWSHDEEEFEPVFARGPAAGGADGPGSRGRPRLAVVGHRLDRGEDRLHGGDLAQVGPAGRARPGPA